MGSTAICKVCGAEYEYCATNRIVNGVNRWQDVACCPEHASKYFAEILKSRQVSKIKTPESDKKDAAKEALVKPRNAESDKRKKKNDAEQA